MSGTINNMGISPVSLALLNEELLSMAFSWYPVLMQVPGISDVQSFYF